VRLIETTRLYFRAMAAIEEDPEMRSAMERAAAAEDPAGIEAAAAVLSRNPLHDAVLRSAASLTILDGGFRANVIPSDGTANFNLRLLPGDDPAAILEEMRRAAGEESVTLEFATEPELGAPPSPVDSDLFRAMEEAANEMAPDAVVMPYMSTGGTDGRVLRSAGIPTYGILPMPLPLEDEMRMHGDDERVPVAALGWATEYLYRVMEGVTR
jgi:acetylornithine deacetylase/succinyl-diaminopimelate desuccinylase-like protein